MKKEMLVNRHFGRLIPEYSCSIPNRRGTYWKCNCLCGKTTIVRKDHLVNGATKSCGCLLKETSAQNGKRSSLKNSLSHITHGESKVRSLEYTTWASMKQRCYDKNHKKYPNYGGQGITVYKPWIHSYEAFLTYILETIGRRPLNGRWSINRIDNNGNYEPGNIEWATDKAQANNRRRRIYA